MTKRHGSRNYVTGGVNEQIVVKNLSVLVHETDEGVVVDIYPDGEEGVDDPIATTYAFFDEGHQPDDETIARVMGRVGNLNKEGDE